MNANTLDSYRKKRDLRKSPEPAGSGRDGDNEKPLFVIQRHDASSEHYDLRLEVDGVLKSWAVPKGPSTDPRDKRLAIHVEDHPLDYADFEGVIPEGEYGAGTVMVWDRGHYRNLKGNGDDAPSIAEQIDDGHVTVWLEGDKLTGGYAVTHTRMGGDEDNWLLVKMDDEAADARRNPVSTESRSAATGRTMEQIRDEEQSNDDGD